MPYSDESGQNLLSIVSPAFNSAALLPSVYAKLERLMAEKSQSWEWIVVDDHSTDRTPEVIAELAAKDKRVSGVRLSRTFGDDTALYCGLSICRGSVAVTWIPDPNSSPELFFDMLGRWRGGAQVVWAQPKPSATAPKLTLFVSIYHWILRHVIGNRDFPFGGIDNVMLDRTVVESLKQMRETNFSIMALVAWMGFRQATVEYPPTASLKSRRLATLRHQVTLIVDVIVSFSMLPIRLAAASGVILAMLGLIYVPVLVYNWWSGAPVTGWTELIVVILILGGLLMIQSSISGEYLWRTLGETRGRPRFIIEASYGVWDHPTADSFGYKRDLSNSSQQ